MGFWTKLLGFAVLATQIAGGLCHGFLAEPKARNVIHNSNYCPHCLAAGGPGLTYDGGRFWPNSRHGVCGDPWNAPLDHEAGGKFATKIISGRYVQGQVITLRITISAPHGGRFSFGVCPLPDTVDDATERQIVTQRCFDKNRLTNTQDGTPYWWYGKKGTGDFTMDFKLPAGVSCKRCVLQWHYESGNSCTIPGTPPQHVMSPNMVPCDQTGVMEEFWNCADISIQGGSGSEPPPAPPKRSKKPKKHKNKHKQRPVESFANDDEDEGPLVAPGTASGAQTIVIAALASIAVVVLPITMGFGIGAAALVYMLVQYMATGRRGNKVFSGKYQ